MFSKDDIELALGLIVEAEIYDKHLKVTLTFAPNKHSRDMEGMPQIQVDQLRHIVRVLYEMNQGEALMEENDLTDEGIVNVLKQVSKRQKRDPNSLGAN